MYKLLIVEDEKWEREGLVDFLDWPKLEIEFIGTAVNGVQGLKMAKEYLPDIIITDIKMPIMDGLELSKEVKRCLPGCRIIIITGYDDFEYAKDAIQFGVCEYLLKPIQKDQLIDAINKTIKSIFQERKQVEYVHVLRHQLTESMYKERERFLLNILEGKLKAHENLEAAKNLNINFCEQDTVAVVIRFDGFFFYRDKECYEKQLHFRELYRSIRRVMGDEGIAALDNTGNLDIILCLPTRNQGRNYINDVIRRIIEEDYGMHMPEFIIGIGSTSKIITKFSESFIQAKAALDRIFFMKEANILFFDDMAERGEIQDSGVNRFITTAFGYSKKLLNSVASMDSQEVIAISEELFDYICHSIVEKSLVCSYFAGLINELSILLLRIDDSFNPVNKISEDILGELHKFIKLEDLKKWFQELLVYTNDCFVQKRNNKEAYIIDHVMDIIRNEYQRNIGVETIACRLELSPNYLSSLFKKHMGKRFTEVLTEFRMKKAEELLVSRTGNIMDIAKAVGFVNASYFCTVFKKTHGISPTNYQEKYSYGDLEDE